MRPIVILFLFAIFSPAALNAQDFVQVSVGAGYSNQAYYTLNNDATTILPNESWDLAFATAPGNAGVFYNESSRSSMATTAPELRLYLAPTSEFSDPINPSELADSLYNPEKTWETGAFNSIRDENDPNDYGWGTFNAAAQAIEGNKVYALKLRNNTWKKISIESLTNSVFTVKYAGLDGGGETTITIDKASFAGSPFAYFSFGTETASASPAGWDLLFARYRDALDPGDGQVLQYVVTGVLSGLGVEVAEARNVDPLDIDYEPYLDSLSSQIDVIGQDWKFFDLGAFSWVVDLNRVYFIKTAENRLWKIVFYTFDGSTTGNITFEKTDLGLLSGVDSPASNFTGFGIYPNPAVDEVTLSFSLKESRNCLPVHLANSLGQIVWQSRVEANAGLNVLNIHPGELPAGLYHLILGSGNDAITAKAVFR